MLKTGNDKDTVLYWDNGNKKVEIDIENMMRTEWYEDGKVKERGGYSNGKKIGTWIFFDDNGTRIFEGEATDEFVCYPLVCQYFMAPKEQEPYHESDIVYVQKFLTNGRRLHSEGLRIRKFEWLDFDLEDGAFGEYYSATHGYMEGYWRYYDINGRVNKQEWYENGVLEKSK